MQALIAELQSPSSSPAAVAGTKEDEGNDVAVGLVLAGDFNSTPISAIYHLLSACVRACVAVIGQRLYRMCICIWLLACPFSPVAPTTIGSHRGELDTRSLNRSWVAGQGWGLMLRSGPHRKMMPYSELAPPSASLSDPHQSQQKRGEEGEGKGRGIRTYRHFGAGTARGVFRPHVRREGAAADMEADEEMGKMRSVARESGLGDSSEGEDEEEEMDVVPRTAVELPAHVPRPLWRHPEEWSREDNGEPIRHALELQRCVDCIAAAGSFVGREACFTLKVTHQSTAFLHTKRCNQMNNSAYAHRPAAHTTGEPAFTTFHAEFKGTVDYVWLTRETLRCSGERARGERVCVSVCERVFVECIASGLRL